MNTLGKLLINSLAQRSVQSIVLITLYIFFADYLTPIQNSFLLTISLAIKDALMMIIPIVVCAFIANTIATFRKQAVLFVISVLIFEWCSNFLSVWYAYACAQLLSSNAFDLANHSTSAQLEPLWRFPYAMPSWWSASKGCFAGLILGCLCALVTLPTTTKFIHSLKASMEWCLKNIFSRLIPLFVLGFLAAAYQSNMLSSILYNTGLILAFLVAILVFYISLLFVIGAYGNLKKAVRHIQNLLPAGAISFMSGCSLSTMPFTIDGTAKNLKDPKLASAIIPATTNIQQIGDCIASTFMAYLIVLYFTGQPPSYIQWIQFSLVYVLARFATAAVLGGAIFVMLPIYEAYLGFSPEMIAVVLAFNVILDPIITSSNVMANGALCKIFENVWGRITSILSTKDSIAKAV